MTLPNSYYDPGAGRRLYGECLEQLAAAERLGYDGVVVEEHHQTAYGTLPAPNLMAAAAIGRTERIRVAVIGNSLPLQGNPLRTPPRSWRCSTSCPAAGRRRARARDRDGLLLVSANPAWSLERFWEAHDLIVRAWTETGPFPGRASTSTCRSSTRGRGRSAAAPAGLAARHGRRGDDRARGRAALPVLDGAGRALVHEGGVRRLPRGGRALRLRGTRPSSRARYRSTSRSPTTQRTARRARTSSGCSRRAEGAALPLVPAGLPDAGRSRRCSAPRPSTT